MASIRLKPIIFFKIKQVFFNKLSLRLFNRLDSLNLIFVIVIKIDFQYFLIIVYTDVCYEVYKSLSWKKKFTHIAVISLSLSLWKVHMHDETFGSKNSISVNILVFIAIDENLHLFYLYTHVETKIYPYRIE